MKAHFSLMAVCALLPAFAAAALAVNEVRSAQRKASLDGMREIVQTTGLRIDKEVQSAVVALHALAADEPCTGGSAFHARARAIDSPGSWTVVIDESGRQILTTRLAFGAVVSADAMSAVEARQLLDGERVVASNLLRSATGKGLVTRIYLPVVAPHHKRCLLARVFTSDFLRGTAMRPGDDRQLIIGVVDKAGTIIVRNRMSQELLGKQASAGLLSAAAAASEGLIRSRTLEGVDAYVTFAHADLTGWIVAVAAPSTLIDGATTEALRWLTAGLVLALLTALGAVTFYTRRVMFAIDGVVAAAQALGRGRRPAPTPGAFKEINAINLAMIDAGRLLSNERDSLAASQADRVRMLDNERRVAE